MGKQKASGQVTRMRGILSPANGDQLVGCCGRGLFSQIGGIICLGARVNPFPASLPSF